MQVPERLALIGGSILLASTLIFTLKSQASSIIPQVSHSISNVYSHVGDTQRDIDFANGFDQAKQNGQRATGHWGTAKYYVDSQQNMYVGAGQLNGSYHDLVDGNQIKSINLVAPVQAPPDSSFLFASISGHGFGSSVALNHINGLTNLDTSQVTDMSDMFREDGGIHDLDLSSFDTSHVTDMSEMFQDNSSLGDLDLSSFNTSHVDKMNDMFDNSSIEKLTLGQDTKLYNNSNSPDHNAHLRDGYQSNGLILNLDGTAHPGTWIKQ